MSLENVKVGDTLVLTHVRRPTEQARVDAVGRKYLTCRGRKYEIETGGGVGEHGYNYRAYTPGQWATSQARDALRAAVQLVWDARPIAPLSDDDMRELTAELEAIARRLGGA